MSAKIRHLFPEELKNAKAERRKQRHKPPLCFVPTKTLESEEGGDVKDKSITVKLCNETTMKVTPYTFNDIESF